MFANAKVEVARVVVVGFEITRAIECEPRFGRWIKVGGAAHKPGMIFCDGVENFGGGITGCDSFGVSAERGQLLVPPVRGLVQLHTLVLSCEIGILRAVFCVERVPLAVQLLSALADDIAEVFAHSVGYEELSVFG